MATSGIRAVSIESYGCTMNQGEAALASSILVSGGYTVQEGGDADAFVIFTCDVIEATENRMWKRIGALHGTGRPVYVAGCLAAIAAEEILERFPRVHVLDTMGIGKVRTSIERSFPARGHNAGPGRNVQRAHHIVPISTGCSGACSYCITRIARGSIKSNGPGAIVEEVRRGVALGRKEILLTSQDSAAYGLDGIGSDLPSLLGRLSDEVEGDHMIRVGMMNPEHVGPRLDGLLDAFSSPRVFKFFHVPLQSGSGRILRAMGRGYGVDEFFRIVASIRERYPMATVSTDMIVGFPGETAEDHDHDMRAVERLAPDILNVTRFSPRRGTPAASMDGQILQRTVKERSREMVSSHNSILRDILGRRMHGARRVLVTEIGKRGTVMGRDVNYTPIVVKGAPELLGTWIDAEPFDLGPTYLIARALGTDGRA